MKENRSIKSPTMKITSTLRHVRSEKSEDITKECKKMTACFSNVKMGFKMSDTFLSETRTFFK